MRIEPLTRRIDTPVGYVINDRQIIGEWGSGGWNSVPRKARLYAPNTYSVRGRYLAGELVANTFGPNGQGPISSMDWHSPRGNPHRIYNLRNSLVGNPEDCFSTLHELASLAREIGANVNSPKGIAWSILRATLGRPIIEHDADIIPIADISRGGRQARYPFMGAEFKDVTSWDIASAYSYTLATMQLPTRWKQYDGRNVPDVPSGFARAVVDIPFMFYGPLPIPIMLRGVEDAYPTSELIEGIWTLDELRAAESWGCRVLIDSYWIGSRYVQPFRIWWAEYQDALKTLGPSAQDLLKMSANALVGQFAASGKNGKHWYNNGKLEYGIPTGNMRALSKSLHALVVGRVRARLWNEALAKLAGFVVAAHTDGVFLTGKHKPQPAGNKPGQWRIKFQTPQMIVIDAQTYSYVDEITGERIFVAAGVPDKAKAQWFGRKLERTRKAEGLGAIRNPTPQQTKAMLQTMIHRY